MTRIALKQLPELGNQVTPGVVLLVGNPNVGKTALFNRLTGLRAKTANFPGITVEHRRARLEWEQVPISLVDLPGLYAMDAVSREEQVARAAIRGELHDDMTPDLIVLVIDATNVERSLFLVSEILELGKPTIVAMNLSDIARKQRIATDVQRLQRELGCCVIPVSARTGEGVETLKHQIAEAMRCEGRPSTSCPSHCLIGCSGCPYADRYDWAKWMAKTVNAVGHTEKMHQQTVRIDRWLTHPLIGLAIFFAVMAGMFYLIFALADLPMTMIESSVMALSGWLIRILPAGDLTSLLTDGVLGGVGGVLVFLPQILILFFLLTLLEDSGYLARAAFVMEKLMRRVGLPGKAFVPMLSAHACAIPGIMAARVIEDWRDRLATILILPLLTCSARLPIFVMIAALLCGENALQATGMFLGAYVFSIAAALGTAFLLKKTILRGESVPLLIELPAYRRPELRTAALTALDRGWLFVKKAGTIILLLSMGLWLMATYPKMPEEAMRPDAAMEIATLRAQSYGDIEQQAEADSRIEQLIARESLRYSAAGRVGSTIAPVFEPLGYDWQITVGIINAFAARELLVSTLVVLNGLDAEAEANEAGLIDSLRSRTDEAGQPVFTTATSLSLLVFFALAMQCLPTTVTVWRETGSWRWPLLQLLYMSGLAYLAAFGTYTAVSLWVAA